MLLFKKFKQWGDVGRKEAKFKIIDYLYSHYQNRLKWPNLMNSSKNSPALSLFF